MNLKTIWVKYNKLLKPILGIDNRLFHLKIKNKGNDNVVTGAGICRMKNVRISFFGNSNLVSIGDMSSMYDVKISISGSNNKVIIGDRNYLSGCVFCMEDDNNAIRLDNHVYIYRNTEISAIESTEIRIGEDSLLSANIMIRTGDSHVIFDKNSGERINISTGITIGKHVWIGNDCKVLKGSNIGEGCVVGTGSTVTSHTDNINNAVLIGVPAKVSKRDVEWKQQR